MIVHEDGMAAINRKKKAILFTENEDMRFTENGRITHAELIIDNDNRIMLATSTTDYESISRHRKHCRQMDQLLQTPYIIDGLLVYVDDVNAHYKNARENGAEILSEIEKGFPGKRYRCADIEGHRWMFM